MYSEPKIEPRYHVSLIGDSAFYANGEILYPPFNLFRILAVLVINGQDRPVSRRHIANLIWSENSPEQINADFRQMLVRIKRFQDEHDIQLLAADACMVWIKPGLEVCIDLAELIQLLANPGPKSAVQICEIYKGDLLGSHRPAGKTFEEWLDYQRQAIRSHFINAISQAILPTSALSLAERQICASRLLLEEPYNEGAYRALMAVSASKGEHSVTRRLFQECRTILQKELGVGPSFETTSYYKSLMDMQNDSMTPHTQKPGTNYILEI